MAPYDFGTRTIGTPLFMRNHTTVESESITPKELIDYIYDDQSQQSSWINEEATNKWTRTMYSDAKIDGVDYI
jgi:hypothetical protein